VPAGLFEFVQGCTIIGIGCVRSADTNNDFWYCLATADTKKTTFFISFKWYRPGERIPKMAYQPISKTFSIVVTLGAARASSDLHGGGRGVHSLISFSLGGGLAPVLKRWWSWVTLVVGE
jgi:hypothetical protein